MFCPNCQRQIRPNSQFCEHCGCQLNMYRNPAPQPLPHVNNNGNQGNAPGKQPKAKPKKKKGIILFLFVFLLFGGAVSAFVFLNLDFIKSYFDTWKFCIQEGFYEFLLSKDTNPITYFSGLKDRAGYQGMQAAYKLSMDLLDQNIFIGTFAGFEIAFFIFRRYLKKTGKLSLKLLSFLLRIINYVIVLVIGLIILDHFLNTTIILDVFAYIFQFIATPAPSTITNCHHLK